MQIAKYYNISYEKFFPTIDLSYANFKGKAKDTTLNSDAIVKILSKYPEIDVMWLITGEGEMLTKKSTQTSDISSEMWLTLKEQLQTLKEQLQVKDTQIRDLMFLLNNNMGSNAQREGGAMSADASGFSEK